MLHARFIHASCIHHHHHMLFITILFHHMHLHTFTSICSSCNTLCFASFFPSFLFLFFALLRAPLDIRSGSAAGWYLYHQQRIRTRQTRRIEQLTINHEWDSRRMKHSIQLFSTKCNLHIRSPLYPSTTSPPLSSRDSIT